MYFCIIFSRYLLTKRYWPHPLHLIYVNLKYMADFNHAEGQWQKYWPHKSFVPTRIAAFINERYMGNVSIADYAFKMSMHLHSRS